MSLCGKKVAGLAKAYYTAGAKFRWHCDMKRISGSFEGISLRTWQMFVLCAKCSPLLLWCVFLKACSSYPALFQTVYSTAATSFESETRNFFVDDVIHISQFLQAILKSSWNNHMLYFTVYLSSWRPQPRTTTNFVDDTVQGYYIGSASVLFSYSFQR